jgi:hypothetical protein
VDQFSNPSNLIASTEMDETITIKLHIMQMTQTTFLKLKPKLFLILVVITLDQAWPSYFLSMLCIYDEEGLLGTIEAFQVVCLY